jgi:hypothetical protein
LPHAHLGSWMKLDAATLPRIRYTVFPISESWEAVDGAPTHGRWWAGRGTTEEREIGEKNANKTAVTMGGALQTHTHRELGGSTPRRHAAHRCHFVN